MAGAMRCFFSNRVRTKDDVSFDWGTIAPGVLEAQDRRSFFVETPHRGRDIDRSGLYPSRNVKRVNLAPHDPFCAAKGLHLLVGPLRLFSFLLDWKLTNREILQRDNSFRSFQPNQNRVVDWIIGKVRSRRAAAQAQSPVRRPELGHRQGDVR